MLAVLGRIQCGRKMLISKDWHPQLPLIITHQDFPSLMCSICLPLWQPYALISAQIAKTRNAFLKQWTCRNTTSLGSECSNVNGCLLWTKPTAGSTTFKVHRGCTGWLAQMIDENLWNPDQQESLNKRWPRSESLLEIQRFWDVAQHQIPLVFHPGIGSQARGTLYDARRPQSIWTFFHP